MILKTKIKPYSMKGFTKVSSIGHAFQINFETSESIYWIWRNISWQKTCSHFGCSKDTAAAFVYLRQLPRDQITGSYWNYRSTMWIHTAIKRILWTGTYCRAITQPHTCICTKRIWFPFLFRILAWKNIQNCLGTYHNIGKTTIFFVVFMNLLTNRISTGFFPLKIWNF